MDKKMARKALYGSNCQHIKFVGRFMTSVLMRNAAPCYSTAHTCCKLTDAARRSARDTCTAAHVINSQQLTICISGCDWTVQRDRATCLRRRKHSHAMHVRLHVCTQVRTHELILTLWKLRD